MKLVYLGKLVMQFGLNVKRVKPQLPHEIKLITPFETLSDIKIDCSCTNRAYELMLRGVVSRISKNVCIFKNIITDVITLALEIFL